MIIKFMEGIKMNAIDFLLKEHNRVRKMLRTISDDSHHYATPKKTISDFGSRFVAS